MAGNELVLLFTMGNQVAIRQLDPEGMRAVDVSDGPDGSRRVVVRLHDLGCPRLAFTLAAADATRWTARLARLAQPSGPDSVPPAMRRTSAPR
jgi:hypothetical protein